MKEPLVTVLMTTYNGEKHLKETLSSVLEQTYRKIEFLIIVEAGTTDRSIDIIDKCTDKRIRRFVNETRLGISASLNQGIKLARGKYIARVDDDDICLPKRIEEQVKIMEKYPSMGMCGTNGLIIDKKNRILDITQLPLSNQSIKMSLYTGNYFLSSSVMMRKQILVKENLCYEGNVSEDYLLWTRIAKKSNVYNISKALVAYRVYEGNRSNHLRIEQEKADKRIQKEMWNNLDIEYPIRNSYIYNIRGKSELGVREEMLRKLFQTQTFSRMKRLDFFATLMTLYKEANMNPNSAFQRYWEVYGSLYGKKIKIYKGMYYLRFHILEAINSLYTKTLIREGLCIYEK